MADHDAPATKRVPKALGTETKLIGDYSLTDLVVAIAPGAAIVMGSRMLLPHTRVAGVSLQTLSLPLALVAIAAGVLFVSLTPAYATSVTWLTAWGAYLTGAPDADHETAPEHTHLERVHPDHDAIERTDGALVGAIEVDPAAMALATDDAWRHTARSFADVLNTTVEFPVQLYATTQSFPVDDYLQGYEARLDDEDVKDNPTLQRLIESYTDWYRRALDEREMTIREHYVIVPVRPESVRYDDESLTQRLAQVPYLGIVVDALRAEPVAAERAAMADALDDRCRNLERALRELDGCSAQRLPAAELTDLLTDFWTQESTTERDTATALRETPLVGGPHR